MKARQFAEQLKDAGFMCFVTDGNTEPTVVVRMKGRDDVEIPVGTIKVRSDRVKGPLIIVEFGG